MGLIKEYSTIKLHFNISKDAILFLDRKVYTDENQQLHMIVNIKETDYQSFLHIKSEHQSHQREQPYSNDTTGDSSVQGRFLRIMAFYTTLETKGPAGKRFFLLDILKLAFQMRNLTH